MLDNFKTWGPLAVAAFFLVTTVLYKIKLVLAARRQAERDVALYFAGVRLREDEGRKILENKTLAERVTILNDLLRKRPE